MDSSTPTQPPTENTQKMETNDSTETKTTETSTTPTPNEEEMKKQLQKISEELKSMSPTTTTTTTSTPTTPTTETSTISGKKHERDQSQKTKKKIRETDMDTDDEEDEEKDKKSLEKTKKSKKIKTDTLESNENETSLKKLEKMISGLLTKATANNMGMAEFLLTEDYMKLTPTEKKSVVEKFQELETEKNRKMVQEELNKARLAKQQEKARKHQEKYAERNETVLKSLQSQGLISARKANKLLAEISKPETTEAAKLLSSLQEKLKQKEQTIKENNERYTTLYQKAQELQKFTDIHWTANKAPKLDLNDKNQPSQEEKTTTTTTTKKETQKTDPSPSSLLLPNKMATGGIPPKNLIPANTNGLVNYSEDGSNGQGINASLSFFFNSNGISPSGSNNDGLINYSSDPSKPTPTSDDYPERLFNYLDSRKRAILGEPLTDVSIARACNTLKGYDPQLASFIVGINDKVTNGGVYDAYSTPDPKVNAILRDLYTKWGNRTVTPNGRPIITPVHKERPQYGRDLTVHT